MHKLYFAALICFLLPGIHLSAQTIISGRVTDSQTDEGIPFATITTKNKTATTDFDGYYKISVNPGDILTATSIGYQKMLTLFDKKDGEEQSLNFELSEAVYTRKQAAAIKRGEKRAFEIMKQVVKFRNSHDKAKLNSYACEAYAKIEMDVDNLKPKVKNNFFFFPMKSFLKKIDTVSEIRPFLPLFIRETVSDIHYTNFPAASREIIKATKVSGIDNINITRFLGSTSSSVNIYSNHITLLDRQFVSPVSKEGLSTYNYFLADSQITNKVKYYRIRFTPKSHNQLTLEGEIWIVASAYAVKRISLGLQHGAEINLVNGISLFNEFTPTSDSIWMLHREKLTIRCMQVGNQPELIARKTVVYKSFVLNEKKKILDSLFHKEGRNAVIRDSSKLRTEAYWTDVREGISTYNAIDTLNKLRSTKVSINVIHLLFSGYFDLGPVSIGNLYSLVGHNAVEGVTFRYSMRTSMALSKDFRFGGYIGYGTDRKNVKYGGEALWFINREPWHYFSATYRNDIVPRANYNYYYTTPTDFFTTSGLRRIENGHPIPAELMAIKELRMNYFREFNFGYSFELGFTHRYLEPLGDFNFNYLTANDALRPNTIITGARVTELSITQRFAWQEKYVSTNFKRFSLGTLYPVVSLQYTIGIKQFMNGDFNYHRLTATVTDNRSLGRAGKLRWSVEAGKVFGNLPFLFLPMPDASETYIMAFNYFNTIQRYQYTADRYVKVIFDHHLDGLIFNRIPGFNKLRLREVYGFKMWWGDLSNTNRTSNYANLAENPANTGLIHLQIADKTPLVEMSAGIENIFRFFRIDAVWRLTHLDPRGSRFSVRYGNFGVRAGMQFQF